MEDLYRILNINPKAGSYKIAITYKKKITCLVNSLPVLLDAENFIKINQAYFVIGNKQGRKFYDILYKCVIENAQHLNERTILNYAAVVNDLSEKGENKVKFWMENPERLKDSDLVKPLFVSFLLQGLLSGNGASLALSGAGGIIYILVSFSFLLKIIMHFNYEHFAMTLFLGILGTAILISRYRAFVVSKVGKETE